MGYLSILVGFFLVLFLICKKWPAIIVGIIATAAVIVMNWLNFGRCVLHRICHHGQVTVPAYLCRQPGCTDL